MMPLFLDFIFISHRVSTILLLIIYVVLFAKFLDVVDKFYLPIAVIFLIPSLILSPYIILAHANIEYNVLSSILETNKSEFFEFLRSGFVVRGIMIMGLLIAVPIILQKFIGKKTFHQKNKWLYLILLILIIISFHVSKINMPNQREKYSGIFAYYPLREMLTLKQFLFNFQFYSNQYDNFTHASDSIASLNNINGILIIGEATRRNSLSLYGSPHKTTPFLDKLSKQYRENIAVYSDAISAATFTSVSVPSLLSLGITKNFNHIYMSPSIYDILNCLGYETILISNQAKKGLYDSLVTTFMRHNRVKTYIKEMGYKYDENLLPFFYETIDKVDDEKKFITLHLMGSHFRYKNRYPESQQYFTPDTHLHNYLNSVRYTDYIIGEIFSAIKNRKEPYIIFYTSDHGEYVNDDGDNIYGHGFKKLTLNEIEVPFFIIFNNAFISEYPAVVFMLKKRTKNQVSHDNVSHTILGILNAKNLKYYNSEYDLVSTEFNEHKRFIVDRGLDVLDVDKVLFN